MFQNQEKEEEQLPWHSVAAKHNATKTTNDNKIGMSTIAWLHITFLVVTTQPLHFTRQLAIARQLPGNYQGNANHW